MANVPISNFTVPANTTGIGASGYSLTGSASASFVDLSGTWNTTGTPTAIKLNITDTASNASSLLMDLQVGGASRFKVDRFGGATLSPSSGTPFLKFLYGYFDTYSTYTGTNANWVTSGVFGFVNSIGSPQDVFIGRRAAANLRLGAADAAAPVPQTLSVQSVVAGTTNTAGANLTITGSQGTGTGAGGSIVFQVAPAGSSGTAQNALATALTINSSSQVVFADGSASLPSIRGSDADSGLFFRNLGTAIAFAHNGVGYMNLDNAGLGVRQNMTIGWASGNADQTGQDVSLFRDAANTLALRNGANAQTFRVYNTTDGTNSEFGSFNWSDVANEFIIATVQTGTGSSRILGLRGQNGINFRVGGAPGTTVWQINTSGHFLAGTDNTYDIGASSANRPRNVYSAGFVAVPEVRGGATRNSVLVLAGNWVDYVTQSGAFSFRITPDNSTKGIVTFSDDSNNFVRLNFGGTTSSYPALKRSITSLQARLADDSAFTNIQGKITTETAYTAGAPTATGYLIIYDSTGTAYRVPAVAN